MRRFGPRDIFASDNFDVFTILLSFAFPSQQALKNAGFYGQELNAAVFIAYLQFPSDKIPPNLAAISHSITLLLLAFPRRPER